MAATAAGLMSRRSLGWRRMRLGVGVAAGAAFLAMLLLDTQGVLQLAWMAVLGRLGVWPQRLFVGVVVVAAGRLVVAEIRRRRPRKARSPAGQRHPAQAGAPAKAARKGTFKSDSKGRRPAAPGMAAGPGRAPARPSRA
jgi:hypothetical protein